MKAVMFDLDGTLLDRNAYLINFVSWQARGMLRSQVLDNALFVDRFIELDANGSVWKDEVYESLIDEFTITGWSVDELLTSYELCFSGFCQPKPGAIAAVNVLKNMGLKLALISNGKSPFQERFNSLGISHLFDAVIISEAVGLRKPDRAIFKLASRILAVKPDRTVFVGDNPLADIKGSRDVGMYSIYITGYYGDKCSDADIICNNFAELPNIVTNAERQNQFATI